MSVVYVNNFDHLLHTSRAPEEVAGSMAALDSPIFVPGHTVSFLGPMHAGAFVTPPVATIEPSRGVHGLAEGTTVTLSNPAAYQSRTFYVVAPNEILLSRGSVFQAELVFDRPTAILPAGLTGKVWAVQLIFKNGNATDHSSGDKTDPTNDVKFGSVCQFNDNGYIKFHGTDNTYIGPLTATYSDYSESVFRLTATITFGPDRTITGIGSLQYDNILQSGHVIVNNFPSGQPFTANNVTAAGFMLTTLGSYETFGVRLRSYTLSVT